MSCNVVVRYAHHQSINQNFSYKLIGFRMEQKYSIVWFDVYIWSVTTFCVWSFSLLWCLFLAFWNEKYIYCACLWWDEKEREKWQRLKAHLIYQIESHHKQAQYIYFSFQKAKNKHHNNENDQTQNIWQQKTESSNTLYVNIKPNNRIFLLYSKPNQFIRKILIDWLMMRVPNNNIATHLSTYHK